LHSDIEIQKSDLMRVGSEVQIRKVIGKGLDVLLQKTIALLQLSGHLMFILTRKTFNGLGRMRTKHEDVPRANFTIGATKKENSGNGSGDSAVSLKDALL